MGLFKSIKKAVKKTVKAVGNVVTGGAIKKKEAAKKAAQQQEAANKKVKDQAAQIQRKENQVGADASFLENDGNEGLGSTAIAGVAGDTSDMLLKRKRLLGS